LLLVAAVEGLCLLLQAAVAAADIEPQQGFQ
jgi:hypothetical protein